MRKGAGHGYWLFRFALLASLASATSLATASEADVPRIVEALRQRQQRLKTVRYVLTGRVLVSKGRFSYWMGDTLPASAGPVVPAEDYEHAYRVDLLIDLAGNRSRRKARTEEFFFDPEDHLFDLSNCWLHPTFRVRLFDGVNAQEYTPRAENTSPRRQPFPYEPELAINLTNSAGCYIEFADEPLLLAHGVVRHFQVRNPLLTPIDPSVFRWHADATVDGRACVVLRTQPTPEHPETFHEYWVDADREAAVIRYVVHLRDKPWRQIDVKHRLTPHGWWPESWTAVDWRGDGVLDMRYEMNVDRFDANIPVAASDFTVKPSPEMIVADRAADVRYRVGEPGQGNIDVRLLAAQDEAARSRRFAIAVSSLVVASIVIAVAGLIAHRKRSRGSRSSLQ